jgi:hypothetical protein
MLTVYYTDISSTIVANICFIGTVFLFLPCTAQPQWSVFAILSEILVPPRVQWLLTPTIKYLLMTSKSITRRQTQSHRRGFVLAPHNRRLRTDLPNDIPNTKSNETGNMFWCRSTRNLALSKLNVGLKLCRLSHNPLFAFLMYPIC